jgi:dTDP-4-amino-4,6-dideoxygalactose transaminase
LHRHAKIRWADIDPWTGLIDPDSVAKLVTSKTKAIIGVNWAGKLCDFKRLKAFGVPVIEDAAHTWDVFLIGEHYARGDYICYSFQAIKFLTTGDGGI